MGLWFLVRFSFLFAHGFAVGSVHFREIALSARCARCYRAAASLILARGTSVPVASPAEGRCVRTSLVHPHRPVNRVRRFITGRVIHPAPDQKGAFAAPFWTSHGPGFHPWTPPLFRQRPRPGRSFFALPPWTSHRPEGHPPDPLSRALSPPLLTAVLFPFWVNLAFTRSNLL